MKRLATDGWNVDGEGRVTERVAERLLAGWGLTARK
jgi:hypothetical protein